MASNYWSPIVLTDEGELCLTEEIIVKSLDWWQKAAAEPSSVGKNVWLLFELFSCRDNLTGRDSSAWPRPVGFKHTLLLGTGWGLDGAPEDPQLAKKYIVDAHRDIFGKSVEDTIVAPNALEDFHNVKTVYGDHFDKLRTIKTRVDPRNRLKGWFKPHSDQGP